MDKFEYEYRPESDEERKQIEKIRAFYAPEEENNLKKLKKLHSKARTPATAAAAATGTAGFVLFGLGMTFSIEWDMLTAGIITGLIGIVILAATLPLHSALIKRGRKKYGKEIVELSDRLLKDR